MMRFGRGLGAMNIRVKHMSSASGISPKDLSRKVKESREESTEDHQ